MSQYGSQRWATGQSYLGVSTTKAGWQCILDHYYNDNGNSTGAGTDLRTAIINGLGGDGGVVYAVDTSTPNQSKHDLWTAKGDGTGATKIVSNRTINRFPSWSPDEKKIVFSSWPGGSNAGEQLYVVNADGSGQQQLTSEPVGYVDWMANWGANHRIAFSCPVAKICTMNEDGSSRAQLASSTSDEDPFWSPDGTKIVFTCDFSTLENSHICVMNSDGSGRVRLTTPTAPGNLDSTDLQPSWSPDGQKIAFSSNRNGSWEIWVVNSDGSGLNWLTFGMGGVYPRWTRDGKSIVFAGGSSYQLYIMNTDGTGLRPLNSQTGLAPWGTLDVKRCRRFDRLNQ